MTPSRGGSSSSRVPTKHSRRSCLSTTMIIATILTGSLLTVMVGAQNPSETEIATTTPAPVYTAVPAATPSKDNPPGGDGDGTTPGDDPDAPPANSFCFICPPGLLLANENALVTNPLTGNPITCGNADSLGAAQSFDAAQCGALMTEGGEACGCVPLPTLNPTNAWTAVPTTVPQLITDRVALKLAGISTGKLGFSELMGPTQVEDLEEAVERFFVKELLVFPTLDAKVIFQELLFLDGTRQAERVSQRNRSRSRALQGEGTTNSPVLQVVIDISGSSSSQVSDLNGKMNQKVSSREDDLIKTIKAVESETPSQTGESYFGVLASVTSADPRAIDMTAANEENDGLSLSVMIGICAGAVVGILLCVVLWICCRTEDYEDDDHEDDANKFNGAAAGGTGAAAVEHGRHASAYTNPNYGVSESSVQPSNSSNHMSHTVQNSINHMNGTVQNSYGDSTGYDTNNVYGQSTGDSLPTIDSDNLTFMTSGTGMQGSGSVAGGDYNDEMSYAYSLGAGTGMGDQSVATASMAGGGGYSVMGASTIGDESTSGFSQKQPMVQREVVAPPGKLGIVIDTTLEGPVVHKVNPKSPLEGVLFPGDIIIAIDDVDTRAMSASAITALMVKTANQQRKLRVLSEDDTGP